MLRLSLFLEPSSRKIRKRNQVLCYESKTPTEVFLTYTPRASFPYSLARLFHRSTHQPPSFKTGQSVPLLHSALVQVLTVRGHKKPRRRKWHIGTVGLRLGNALRSHSALPWLLDVAPFPCRRSRLVNCAPSSSRAAQPALYAILHGCHNYVPGRLVRPAASPLVSAG
jgi:hypothetical protein